MRRLLPVLVAGLVLAACGSGTDDAGGPAPSSTASPAVAPSVTTDAPSSGIESPDAGSPDTEPTSPVDSAPAVGSVPPATERAPTSEPTDEGSAVVPAEAPEALRFSAPLIGGGDVELTTLAGRPVLLWFWAPW